MAIYMDSNGLFHFWNNIIKPRFENFVEKIEGKGLSTNDFTNEDVELLSTLDNNITALKNTKVDKVTGKGLSANDFTDEYKNAIDQHTIDIQSLDECKVEKVSGKDLSTNDFTNEHKELIELNKEAITSLNSRRASDIGGVVYDAEQYLVDDQKAKARSNIGALGAGDSINAASLNGKSAEYYIQPDDLLVNGNFMEPVNQRGTASPSSTAGTYLFDRWRINSGTWAYDENGLTMTESGNIQQRIPFAYEKNEVPHTIGIYYTDGGVDVKNYGAMPVGASGEYFYMNIVPELNRAIRAIALYKGTYTADTLPPYVPKGYAVELAECMRYYRRYKNILLAGVSHGVNVFACAIDGYSMLATPSIGTNTTCAWIDVGEAILKSGLTPIISTPGRINITTETEMVNYSGGAAYFTILELSSELH